MERRLAATQRKKELQKAIASTGAAAATTGALMLSRGRTKPVDNEPEKSSPSPSVLSESKIKLTLQQKRARDVMIFSKCVVEQAGLLLWHYMGTGKTLTAIAIAENVAFRVLVFCPSYLKYVWEAELVKWGATKAKYSIHGYDDAAGVATALADEDESVAKRLVIVDEVQNVLVREQFLLMGLVKNAEMRLLLSGTPINQMQDLGLLMSILKGRDDKMTQADFTRKYTQTNYVNLFIKKAFKLSGEILDTFFGWLMIMLDTNLIVLFSGSLLPLGSFLFDLFGYNRNATKWDTLAIAQKLKDYVSFVADPGGNSDGEDGFPALLLQTVRVPLSKDQMELSDRWMIGRLTSQEVARLGIANSLFGMYFVQPSQIANNNEFQERGRSLGMYHPTNAIHSSKGEMLAQIVRMIHARKEKAMIYTSLLTDCGVLGVEHVLKHCKIDYVFMDSRATDQERQAANKRFNSGDVSFMINYNVAEGFSLFECMYVIFVEPVVGNVAKYQQIIARARRLTSHRHLPKEKQWVRVIHLISTIEKPDMVRAKLLQVLEGVIKVNDNTGKYYQNAAQVAQVRLKNNKKAKSGRTYSESQLEDGGRAMYQGRFDIFKASGDYDSKGNIIQDTEATAIFKMILSQFAAPFLNATRKPSEFIEIKRMRDKEGNSTNIGQTGQLENFGRTAFSTSSSRMQYVLTHSVRPILLAMRLLIMPKVFMKEFRRWWKGYADAEENEKTKFALGEAGGVSERFSSYTPDEISQANLSNQMGALQDIIDKVAQLNIQKDEYPHCVRCLTWPEHSHGCQKTISAA